MNITPHSINHAEPAHASPAPAGSSLKQVELKTYIPNYTDAEFDEELDYLHQTGYFNTPPPEDEGSMEEATLTQVGNTSHNSLAKLAPYVQKRWYRVRGLVLKAHKHGIHSLPNAPRAGCGLGTAMDDMLQLLNENINQVFATVTHGVGRLFILERRFITNKRIGRQLPRYRFREIPLNAYDWNNAININNYIPNKGEIYGTLL